MITFEELTQLAIKEGIAPNKVSVGLWAKIKGYKKKKRQINNIVHWYYYTPEMK